MSDRRNRKKSKKDTEMSRCEIVRESVSEDFITENWRIEKTTKRFSV